MPKTRSKGVLRHNLTHLVERTLPALIESDTRTMQVYEKRAAQCIAEGKIASAMVNSEWVKYYEGSLKTTEYTLGILKGILDATHRYS